MSGYTMQVDVKSDGNRRIQSDAGVLHQRYQIALIGNGQLLEVSSNHDRLKESIPFKWKPGTWYSLKTRVEPGTNGAVMIRAKAWERDQPEPGAWTIEVAHRNGHRHGAAGLYAFSPQAKKRVFIDNLTIQPNAK
jgi:hypothetical protein